jgi:EAL and modified HD-GYP domain-containing signal transduction protein
VLDVGILGQVALGYSPFIDRNRTVFATRLTVFPLHAQAQLDAAQLLHAVGGVWPASGGRVSLNVASESLLQDLLRASPSTNLMIEVPAFMAGDPVNVAAIEQLHRGGSTLLIKGRPLKPLPREVLPCFKYSIIDLADDRRGDVGSPVPAGITRSIPHVQAGVRSVEDMQTSFHRGAHAVLGWPIDDPVTDAAPRATKTASQPDLQVMVELIDQVDKEAPIEKLEATFKLMRYINSPGFGMQVELSSFRHAIMMLGYKRLKRWLALLLVTASKDINLKPLMFAAVRRGLLMEELVRSDGSEEMRSEMFICGVFSLLDRMFQMPFSELLATIPVPERVYQALAEGSGPYQPYVEVVRAVESESLFDFREASERLMMSVSEINRAQLRALTAASQLE